MIIIDIKKKKIDKVRAYHIGDRLLVEVHIVLPPNSELREVHDLGEGLQVSLLNDILDLKVIYILFLFFLKKKDAFEMLENVERAFVHLDYNSTHEIEHSRVINEIGFGS